MIAANLPTNSSIRDQCRSGLAGNKEAILSLPEEAPSMQLAHHFYQHEGSTIAALNRYTQNPKRVAHYKVTDKVGMVQGTTNTPGIGNPAAVPDVARYILLGNTHNGFTMENS